MTFLTGKEIGWYVSVKGILLLFLDLSLTFSATGLVKLVILSNAEFHIFFL